MKKIPKVSDKVVFRLEACTVAQEFFMDIFIHFAIFTMNLQKHDWVLSGELFVASWCDCSVHFSDLFSKSSPLRDGTKQHVTAFNL